MKKFGLLLIVLLSSLSLEAIAEGVDEAVVQAKNAIEKLSSKNIKQANIIRMVKVRLTNPHKYYKAVRRLGVVANLVEEANKQADDATGIPAVDNTAAVQNAVSVLVENMENLEELTNSEFNTQLNAEFKISIVNDIPAVNGGQVASSQPSEGVSITINTIDEIGRAHV